MARKKSKADEPSLAERRRVRQKAGARARTRTTRSKALGQSSSKLASAPAAVEKNSYRKSEIGNESFPVVGIGASAGGLEAFTLLLQHLPTDTGMGFVLVQHLDPVHESALTKLLSKATSMPMRQVTNNLPVEANHVYIIPPNTTLKIFSRSLF